MAVVDLRYARALDEVVLEQKLPRDAVKRQLNDLLATFAESPALREVMEDPSIPEDQKLRVLDAIASRIGMDGAVRNFVALVIHHLRLPELQAMVESYLQRADQDSRVTEAEVTTARPLDAEGKHSLEESIAKLTGGSAVTATYREDPALLGGAVIRVGSTVYDGSIRGQLEQMKQRMVAATF